MPADDLAREIRDGVEFWGAEADGFRVVAPEDTAALLRTYWTISPRQVETSVVLTDQP